MLLFDAPPSGITGAGRPGGGGHPGLSEDQFSKRIKDSGNAGFSGFCDFPLQFDTKELKSTEGYPADLLNPNFAAPNYDKLLSSLGHTRFFLTCIGSNSHWRSQC